MPKISRVKLLKQVKIDSAWILAPTLLDSKGRIRRDHVMIDGRDEIHPEGSYFLEFWDQGKRKREAVGPEAFIAADRAKHRQAELAAIRSGLIETPVIVEAQERTKLTDALEKYSEYIQYHRSLRTFRTYRPILKAFGEFCSHIYVDQIDRADLMEFATHCLKLGQTGKTIYNKLGQLHT